LTTDGDQNVAELYIMYMDPLSIDQLWFHCRIARQSQTDLGIRSIVPLRVDTSAIPEKTIPLI
jgi:hypothetical protein